MTGIVRAPCGVMFARERERETQVIIPMEKVYRIFSNLEDILLVNRELLCQLTARIEDEGSDRVGDIFLTMSFALKIYARYIGEYDIARSTHSRKPASSRHQVSRVVACIENLSRDTHPRRARFVSARARRLSALDADATRTHRDFSQKRFFHAALLRRERERERDRESFRAPISHTDLPSATSRCRGSRSSWRTRSSARPSR